MRRQAGFTLLELLVALAVGALVAALAWQLVDQVVRLRSQTLDHWRHVDALERCWWWMEQDVMQMAPRPVRDAYGSMQPAMVLGVDGVWRFSRTNLALTRAGVPGIERVSWFVRGDALIRRSWPVVDRAVGVRPRDRVMLTGVRAFRVRLWPQAGQASRMEWPPQDAQGRAQLRRLPTLVQVTLTLKDGVSLNRWWVGVQ